MSTTSLPCVILGYSRFESLIKLVQQADRIGFSPIYISVDGPSSHEVSEIQDQIKLGVEAVSLSTKSKIVTNFHEANLGVAGGIISGIDWFFSIENFGAILEDDLELSDDFYRYIEFGRTYLENNNKCLLVSGCRFSSTSNSLALTNYPLIWGWATSRSNWNRMRSGLLAKPRRKLSLNSRQNYWNVGSRRVHDGLIDTWDIPLASFMLEENFLCLLPPVNLTTNVGFDMHAAHTKSFSFPLGLPHSSLPDAEFDFLGLQEEAEIENNFLDKNVYNIVFKHRFLSIYYWLQKPFVKRRYASLKSRILGI